LQLNHEHFCLYPRLGRAFTGEVATQTYHQVQTNQVLLLGAKQIAQQPFNSVAIDRKMFNLPCDYQPQSRICEIIGFGKNLEKFAAGGTPEPEDGRKLFRVVQPAIFRQKTNNTDPQVY